MSSFWANHVRTGRPNRAAPMAPATTTPIAPSSSAGRRLVAIRCSLAIGRVRSPSRDRPTSEAPARRLADDRRGPAPSPGYLLRAERTHCVMGSATRCARGPRSTKQLRLAATGATALSLERRRAGCRYPPATAQRDAVLSLSEWKADEVGELVNCALEVLAHPPDGTRFGQGRPGAGEREGKSAASPRRRARLTSSCAFGTDPLDGLGPRLLQARARPLVGRQQ